ncbi:MAG: hypothetical protein QNJ46_24980 [Leptolyngbyaceae cyanobacterium MO_188.B28]|nr:hypothetical protein [Leptolyngbyaceae cyanobacterium MO_188.B28]
MDGWDVTYLQIPDNWGKSVGDLVDQKGAAPGKYPTLEKQISDED